MEIRLHENGLVGTFRTPEGSGPFPAVLALGGSDGGTPEYFLNLCVAEGFACLALAYWGTAGMGAGQFDDPHYFSVDEDGNVYVAIFSNTKVGVEKYTPKPGADKARLIAAYPPLLK